MPEGPSVDVPFLSLWEEAGHSDSTAEAFRHWDEDDPVEVPTRCAKCHSAYGYLDFLGADGTEAGVVDNAAPVDSVINCVTCHNEATMEMTSVVFPSGAEITGLGDDARCMQCHQGRESTVSVDADIEALGLGDDDISTGEDALGFANIHYYAAAATRYGTFAMGGYQYAGKTYDGFFAHVEEFDNCNECHNPHSLEVEVEGCTTCHEGVATVEDLRDQRMFGSTMDYDGDGDMEEGIYFEIAGLQEALYAAIQTYSADNGGAITYDSSAYPYWFNDAGEGYAAWTPRLLRAAYNYQVVTKDPGGYAHGGKYLIQLLYDSIEDLGGDVSSMHRADAGHFDGAAEAYRHWDEDGEVSGSCARCHSADGLPTFLENGANVATEIANGMQCVTCHDHENFPALYSVDEMELPSGETVTFGEGVASNLCLACHQGLESSASVEEDIEGLPLDIASEDLSFSNVHYYAAGATIFGGEARGAYEFAGQTYNGQSAHPEGYSQCAECHDAHNLGLMDGCFTCHAGVDDVNDIRISGTDFDGDGDTDEGIVGEIETMHEALYAAIQANAAANSEPIVYDSHAYPYFFTDLNADGAATPDEANYGNRYITWTPRLVRAAYNYQYVAKDPGAFAHNPIYVIQILYDTLNDLGAAGGMTRP
jgi:hypothetical protein